MRNILMVMFFFVLLSAIVICQENNDNLTIKRKMVKSVMSCSKNPDSLYERQQTLEKISDILNDSIPEFGAKWNKGFFIKDEMPWRFGIYDLTDISNRTSIKNDYCINFIDKHIYHVFPNDYSYSFSHIIILEGGRLKVFKSINCKDRGDTLKDVIYHLNQILTDSDKKDEIMNRVRNYREYGYYRRIDPMVNLQCQEN